MNVKQEPLPEGICKTEVDIYFGQTFPKKVQMYKKEHENVLKNNIMKNEIKQEIIECEKSNIIEQRSDLLLKIYHDRVPDKKNVHFYPITIKKELDNASEVNTMDIKDIKEDINEYVQSEAELLTTHCDLPTLKNENNEYEYCLAESCDGEQDERISNPLKINTNDVLILKKEHLITHTNKKPFKCSTCFKEFNGKSIFQNHLRTHTNQKPFKCCICSRKFNQKFNLKRHLITHTNEKHFTCDICSKEFTQKSSLERHLISHTKEKPLLQCDICYKEFTRKFSLHQHLLTHPNVKPFKCDICCKEFTQKFSLTRHLIIHTDVKPFKCVICSMEFSQKSSLKRHLITH